MTKVYGLRGSAQNLLVGMDQPMLIFVRCVVCRNESVLTRDHPTDPTPESASCPDCGTVNEVKVYGEMGRDRNMLICENRTCMHPLDVTAIVDGAIICSQPACRTRNEIDADDMPHTPPEYGRVMLGVTKELMAAYERYPRRQASYHEGLAVLREEYLELEAACFWGLEHRASGIVRWHREDQREVIRKEATQVAAMAIRLILDTCEDR